MADTGHVWSFRRFCLFKPPLRNVEREIENFKWSRVNVRVLAHLTGAGAA